MSTSTAVTVPLLHPPRTRPSTDQGLILGETPRLRLTDKVTTRGVNIGGLSQPPSGPSQLVIRTGYENGMGGPASSPQPVHLRPDPTALRAFRRPHRSIPGTARN